MPNPTFELLLTSLQRPKLGTGMKKYSSYTSLVEIDYAYKVWVWSKQYNQYHLRIFNGESTIFSEYSNYPNSVGRKKRVHYFTALRDTNSSLKLFHITIGCRRSIVETDTSLEWPISVKFLRSSYLR
jgi:hypothetical protein